MLYLKNGCVIEQNVVSIEDRAFLYGDGCFSTARIRDGKILLWQRHLQRLEHAISVLRLNCDIESIKIHKDILLNHLSADASGVVKIMISRGVSPQRGYAIPQQSADIYFYFYPLQVTQSHPTIMTKVGIMSEGLGSSMACLKGVKTLNRLEQVILKDIATQQQWDEALCFDLAQNLVEGISSNCFVYIDGCWHTPDLALTGIAGVMRQEILLRMQHYQIPHQIRMIHQSELSYIQAGFFCNALYPMQIIKQLLCDGQPQPLDEMPCISLFQSLQLQQLV